MIEFFYSVNDITKMLKVERRTILKIINQMLEVKKNITNKDIVNITNGGNLFPHTTIFWERVSSIKYVLLLYIIL